MQINIDRFEGCLLGLACGDAVGTTVEFIPRGHFKPVTDMCGGGKFRLNPGEWTDDTSMALCLADSLLACDGFDAKDQMERYVRWVETGYNSARERAFGVGKTVIASLSRFSKSGDPYSGLSDEKSSGNGSLMRLAPIPMFYFGNPVKVLEFAELMSRTTHASAECIASCQYLAIVIMQALSGENDKEKILHDEYGVLQSHNLERIKNQLFRHKSADQIIGSGYVVESIEAALWSFWHTSDPNEAILTAANLGDDADTTAAICGQLAGAFYGASAISPDWKKKLYRGTDIVNLSRELANRSCH